MLFLASSISFEQPLWLLLLVTIPVIVLVSLRSLRALDGPRRVLAVSLRSLLIALFAVVLARIHYVRTSDHLAVFFLLDRSRSISDEQRAKVEDYVRRSARQAEIDDRVAIIGFDGETSIDVPPSRAGGAGGAYVFGSAIAPDRTDVARALRMALASFPEGYGRRIVIASDMNQNMGDVLAEAETAAANGAVVDILPLTYEYENEMLFDRLAVPTQARRDTKITLRMIVRSRKSARARLRVFHDDGRRREAIPLEKDVIELAGGMRPEPFFVPYLLQSGGVHRFDAVIEPLDEKGDTLPQNNVASAFTHVDDQGRVLVLTDVDVGEAGLREDGREEQKDFVAALRAEKIAVEMAAAGDVPVDDPLFLQAYGVVVLANVSADKFTDAQKQALATYVRDLGGGLIMTGGPKSFGAGGWIGSPIEEISPVYFEVRHKRVIPRGALAIIMHSCEIDRGNYWGEQVAIASVKAISSRDYIGVLAYTWSPGGVNWEVPMQEAVDKEAVIRKIRQMQIGDMPDFGTAMDMAARKLVQLPGVSQKHVIIISDGDPARPAQTTIDFMRANHITCSTVGIGYGQHVMEQTLVDIAKASNGRFYACKNPRQLPQIFVKEAKVVRRSLIEEEDFRPSLVYGLAETTRGFSGVEFPALKGIVLTTPKEQPIEMPLVRAGSDGNDPLMAHWQFELGRVLVFTSGWWPRWGPQWQSWSRFGAFWAQAVRWAMRQPGSADFDVVTRLEGDKGHIVVEALNKDRSYLNEMTFDAARSRLVTPDSTGTPFRLTQTGPGRYEGTFDVKDNGWYLVNLRYTAGQESGWIRTGLTLPYSPEYRELSANRALMEQVRSRTGGRILTGDPKTDDLFHFSRPRTESRQPIWRWVVIWLLLPLFLLDVAGRRLASALAMSIYAEGVVLAVLCGLLITARAPWWSCLGAVIFAELIGWTIRRDAILPTIRYFTHTVWVLGRAGQRSRESLSHLRTARQRVRGELAEQQERARAAGAGVEPASTPPEPLPDRRARFDVGEEAASRKAGDLTEALGGATVATDEAEGPGRAVATGPASQTDLTSRLLRAKRRAQRDIEAKKEEKND